MSAHRFPRIGLCSYLFPRSCVACDAFLYPHSAINDGPLCQSCYGAMQQDLTERIAPQRCIYCGYPLISEIEICTRCKAVGTHTVRNRSIFIYQGVAQQLIWAYKFGHAKQLAQLFCTLLYALWSEHFANIPIIPIPSSPKNIKKRGWDQIRCIAHALHKQYAIPVIPILARTAKTNQKSLRYEQRKENAKAAYQMKKRMSLQNHSSALLLDDVYTTGATMHACAEILSAAGVETIFGMTIAITP